MKYKKFVISAAVLSTTLLNASWMDTVTSGLNAIQEKPVAKTEAQNSTTSVKTDLSTMDMNGALKQALNNGVSFAISSLGKENGYLNNALTKITLPESMQKTADLVRKAGGDKYVDDLILAMNNAATQAAPKTAEIFSKSIANMSIDDAQNILSGSEKAATDYFRKTTTKDLQSTISPIIQKSMDDNSVAKYYAYFQSFYKEHAGALKNEYVSGAANMLGYGGVIPSDKDEDLNSFITNKSIDGIMVMIQEKEKEIRKSPLSQNSDLIGKVFSVFK
jgi:hypothetical protein